MPQQQQRLPAVSALATRPRSRFHSKQDVRTPHEFIVAVEKRFGLIVLDLAAKDGDECKPLVAHMTPEQNSLAAAWPTKRHHGGVYFLNPPFADVDPWAAKCADWRAKAEPGVVVALLVPTSSGTEWWRDHVRGQALVYALSPRVTFIGHKHPFPKELVLCVYDPRHFPAPSGLELWRWR